MSDELICADCGNSIEGDHTFQPLTGENFHKECGSGK